MNFFPAFKSLLHHPVSGQFIASWHMQGGSCPSQGKSPETIRYRWRCEVRKASPNRAGRSGEDRKGREIGGNSDDGSCTSYD